MEISNLFKVLAEREISAKKSKYLKPYSDTKKYRNNLLLTKTQKLSMNYAKNKNVFVIGSAGSGKTRNYVIPNIMQMNSSYIISGSTSRTMFKTIKMLQKNNYTIKVINTDNINKTMYYNPFEYIRSDEDILNFVEVLLNNTNGLDYNLWIKAEKLLLTSYIALILYFPKEEQSIEELFNWLNLSLTSNEENFQNSIDLMFEALEEEHPSCFAVNQYKQYKLAVGKNAESVLNSCRKRLDLFNRKEVKTIMRDDEMQLDKIGYSKTALFVIFSKITSEYKIIINLFISQLFRILSKETKSDNMSCLKNHNYHISCFLDDFSYLSRIPDFEKSIIAMRNNEVSVSIISQSYSQMKSVYKDAADTIIKNCDIMLFLGGYNISAIQELSENYDLNWRELFKKQKRCIVKIRGMKPLCSYKYNIIKHPRYKELKKK